MRGAKIFYTKAKENRQKVSSSLLKLVYKTKIIPNVTKIHGILAGWLSGRVPAEKLHSQQFNPLPLHPAVEVSSSLACLLLRPVKWRAKMHCRNCKQQAATPVQEFYKNNEYCKKILNIILISSIRVLKDESKNKDLLPMI